MLLSGRIIKNTPIKFKQQTSGTHEVLAAGSVIIWRLNFHKNTTITERTSAAVRKSRKKDLCQCSAEVWSWVTEVHVWLWAHQPLCVRCVKKKEKEKAITQTNELVSFVCVTNCSSPPQPPRSLLHAHNPSCSLHPFFMSWSLSRNKHLVTLSHF